MVFLVQTSAAAILLGLGADEAALVGFLFGVAGLLISLGLRAVRHALYR